MTLMCRGGGGQGREAPDSRLIRTDPSHPEQKPVQNSKNVDLTQDTAPNEKKKCKGTWKELGSRQPHPE